MSLARRIGLALSLVSITAVTLTAQVTKLATETPEKLKPADPGFDYVRRDEMIPMRDGVKLHTVILIPKGARRAPMLLTRTPYSATATTSYSPTTHMATALDGYDNALDVIIGGGYIRVVQDVRGKYGSEGDYVMNRPLRGPLNDTPVDHATDTYDTVDWLVKSIPESNGKVGILGISYDGFTAAMGLVDPHPALKVAVPMNPMIDGWIGDDWFHNGAFRQYNLSYIYEQVGTRDNSAPWWNTHYDQYDAYLQAGSAGDMAASRGLEQIGFWQKILAHPNYDAFWQQQAVDKLLGARPLAIPTLIVHSLWDAEDSYGAMALYQALEPKDTNNDRVYLVMGPWHHGGEIDDGSVLGALHWGSNTSTTFQKEVLLPFFDHYLKDDGPRMDISPVTAFESGTNRWHKLDSWPSCGSGCTVQPTPLYLQADGKLGFELPTGAGVFDEYVSDPAKPVPFRVRPTRTSGYETPAQWADWLADDQREFSTRTDVLSYVTDRLTAPVRVSGSPRVNLVASTTGTDADWVVKLIDVYPDEVPVEPSMGGFQFPVAMEIFRGRYRESFETPQPIAPNRPLTYKFALPTVSHVFLPGHRIMVQVQSSWFPLYDRNPQTFVPNVMLAKPGDYRKATQRVYRASGQASFVELPLDRRP
ncbi:MAG: CocE/NonD family hydrolase [Gemmatimonadaceae bacterium]